MERGAVLVIYACWLLTKTHGFLPGPSFPGRRLSQANYAASNETHMHDVDMLYAGPGANGREAPANLSPRGQAVVTSLASRFLILPMCRAERLPRHGSRQGFGLNLRRGGSCFAAVRREKGAFPVQDGDVGGRTPEAGRSYLEKRKHFVTDSREDSGTVSSDFQ